MTSVSLPTRTLSFRRTFGEDKGHGSEHEAKPLTFSPSSPSLTVARSFRVVDDQHTLTQMSHKVEPVSRPASTA